MYVRFNCFGHSVWERTDHQTTSLQRALQVNAHMHTVNIVRDTHCLKWKSEQHVCNIRGGLAAQEMEGICLEELNSRFHISH